MKDSLRPLIGASLAERQDLDPAFSLQRKQKGSKAKKILKEVSSLKKAVLITEILKNSNF